jgi:hypothetical protein
MHIRRISSASCNDEAFEPDLHFLEVVSCRAAVSSSHCRLAMIQSWTSIRCKYTESGQLTINQGTVACKQK